MIIHVQTFNCRLFCVANSKTYSCVILFVVASLIQIKCMKYFHDDLTLACLWGRGGFQFYLSILDWCQSDSAEEQLPKNSLFRARFELASWVSTSPLNQLSYGWAVVILTFQAIVCSLVRLALVFIHSFSHEIYHYQQNIPIIKHIYCFTDRMYVYESTEEVYHTSKMLYPTI